MTELNKSSFFYRTIIASIVMLIISIGVIGLLFYNYANNKKLIAPIIILIPATIIGMYYFIYLIGKIVSIKFNSDCIYFNDKKVDWNDFSKIKININDYFNGKMQVTTNFIIDKKELKIVNRFYTNIIELTQFLKSNNKTKQILEIIPTCETSIKDRFLEDKKYIGYRISTHLFLIIYLFVILYFLIETHVDNNMLFLSLVFIFLITLFLFFFLATYVAIDNNVLTINLLLLPYTICRYPLNDVYAVKYISEGSGRNSLRKLMIITKNFESKKMSMETLPYKKFKELRDDLRKAKIIVYDDRESLGLNLKANYAFNLTSKKRKKQL